MTLSAQGIAAANAQKTGECIVWLVELSPPGQAVQRYCNQHAAIVSNGVTYSPLAFDVRLSDQLEGTIPSAEFVCDDTLRAVSQAFRTSSGRVPCVVRMVLADSPNAVEAETTGSIAAITYGDGRVSGKITETTVDEEAFGKLTFTPGLTPGIFT